MRWVKLKDLTYKDFKEWCLDKKLYGYWTYEVMFVCDDIQKSMKKIPPWSKKKVWNEVKYILFAEDTVLDIMESEDIKRKMMENGAIN